MVVVRVVHDRVAAFKAKAIWEERKRKEAKAQEQKRKEEEAQRKAEEDAYWDEQAENFMAKIAYEQRYGICWPFWH